MSGCLPDREVKRESRTCELHGEYTSITTVTVLCGIESAPRSSECPECQSQRMARYEREEAERKERERRWRVATNREVAAIPLRFARCVFDNYTATTQGQKNALFLARGFAENFPAVMEAGSSLTLCGSPGCGKTHLACAIGNHLLTAGQTVRYTQVIELIRAIRDTWRHESNQTEGAVISKLQKVDLLILDEVGVSLGSESERTQLFDVLDGRYRAMRPTVFVSNLNAKGLQDALGLRIFDRMTQNGSAVVIFNWESYRLTAPMGVQQ
jgi:DNA replication protein DnaC